MNASSGSSSSGFTTGLLPFELSVLRLKIEFTGFLKVGTFYGFVCFFASAVKKDTF